MTPLETLRHAMRRADLAGVALVPGANLQHLTGAQHFLMERPFMLFVPQDGEAIAALPALEADEFAKHGFPARLFPWSDAEGYHDAFRCALTTLNLGGKKLGVEGLRLRFFEGELLRALGADLQLVSADKVIAEMRLHKTAEDLQALQTAIDLSEAALRDTLAKVRLGMSEAEVTSRLKNALWARGAQGLAFEPIVLTGANSANPHGMPSAATLQRGDALLVDFGGSFGGYHADITRTFFLGEVSDSARHLYEAVLAANSAGRAAVAVGASAASVDEAARAVLQAQGYADLIVHRTGHGLGREVHEDPYIVATNPQALELGMVFTIEPGLYRAGELGVRIEDNVVVTPEGGHSLTRFPRELQVLTLD
jgi:Xaa-Pro dipeptidase